MARIKIDYGIDLGTTNSAICRMDRGEPTIIKSDALKDVMPSCVAFNKRKSIGVGDRAYNNMKSDKRHATISWRKEASNTYIEFKRTMGTDTRYYSSYMDQSFSSEELSAEVLKTLKSFVLDENVTAAIITVPAKFTVNQKTATLQAAHLAGFTQCELLQEPIAAAMAYGLTAESKNGLWMVFDFGGGTFDAALLKVEDGIMQVFDTEGDNYLGGKNLDYAIVDKIIIPYLQANYVIDAILADDDKKEILRDAMKTYAEEAKNQLSFKSSEDIISNLGELGTDDDGEEIELDLTITQDAAFAVMRPYFQKAVDICKTLLERNSLRGSNIAKLILVGGPTHCPLIRTMLREQITRNVDTSIDPMTAVATGAALYASTIDAQVSDSALGQGTVKLDLDYEATSVEDEEWVSVKLPQTARYNSVYVEFVRSDNAWSSGKVEIDKRGNVVPVDLLPSKPNSFTVRCYDAYGNSLPCFPDEITIIQGSKVGAAPLPYNIGIGIWDDVKQREKFRMAKGLEKNKPVPAVGVVNGLKTTMSLRPGIDDDTLTVPVYQVDDFAEAEGKPTALYEHVGTVRITGEEVEELIPIDSELDITLKVDTSEQMTLEVHFIQSDLTIDKPLDTTGKGSIEEMERTIDKGLDDAHRSLARLQREGVDTTSVEETLSLVDDEAKNSAEKKMVLQHLKEVLRKIEDIDSSTEWQRVEKELREEFADLERAQKDLGTIDTGQQVQSLRHSVNQAIHKQDVATAREVKDQVHSLYFQLTLVYQCIGLIRFYDKNFSHYSWLDRNKARQLINQGLQKIADHPTKETLLPIARNILNLLPEREREGTPGGGILR